MRRIKTTQDQIDSFKNGYVIGENGCWIWSGQKFTSNGFTYGRTPYGRYPNGIQKMEFAHRLSYLIHKGDLLSGYHIHHKCEVTLCVNPDHLDQLTPREHMLVSAGSNAHKSHFSNECKNGHKLEGDNLRMCPNGWRRCAECSRKRSRKYKETKSFDIRNRDRKQKSAQAAKTHCKKGHPYSGNNLKWNTFSYGSSRACKTCVYIRSKFAYEKRQGRCVDFNEFLAEWKKHGLKQDPYSNFYPDSDTV